MGVDVYLAYGVFILWIFSHLLMVNYILLILTNKSELVLYLNSSFLALKCASYGQLGEFSHLSKSSSELMC